MLKKYFTVLLALFFILSLRILFYTYNPAYYYYPDTYSYLNRAEEIAKGEPIIDSYRLPLYPLILKNILKLNGKISYDVSNINSINFQPVINLQQDLALIATLFFIYIAYAIFGKNWQLIFVSILFATNIYIFAWEKNLLTESITTSLLLIFIAAIIKFIKSPSFWYILLAALISIYLFLLRPLYIFISISVLPLLLFYLFRKKNYHLALISTILLISTLIVPLYYSLENNRLHQYPGISKVIEIDLFGKIIQYQLNPLVVKNPSPTNQILIHCLIGRDPGLSILTNDCTDPLHLDPALYPNGSAPIVGNFARQVILKQPLLYIYKSLLLLPHSTMIMDHDPFAWISTYAENKYLANLWSFSYKFYGYLHILVLSFFFLFPYQIYLFIKKPDQVNTTLSLLGIGIFYVLLFNTFFVQFEYSRLRVPIEPEILIFCSYYFFKLIKHLKNQLKSVIK